MTVNLNIYLHPLASISRGFFRANDLAHFIALVINANMFTLTANRRQFTYTVPSKLALVSHADFCSQVECTTASQLAVEQRERDVATSEGFRSVRGNERSPVDLAILGKRTVTWCVGRSGPWWSSTATRSSFQSATSAAADLLRAHLTLSLRGSVTLSLSSPARSTGRSHGGARVRE